jgi:hypothetical protein
MNRHYKRRNVKILKPVFIAYRDYASHTSCARVYGIFESLKKAQKWVRWDAEFQERCGYKISDVIDYNDKNESIPLGNRIGPVYEIRMNKSGKIIDDNKFRYVVYQTYMNMPAV